MQKFYEQKLKEKIDLNFAVYVKAYGLINEIEYPVLFQKSEIIKDPADAIWLA